MTPTAFRKLSAVIFQRVSILRMLWSLLKHCSTRFRIKYRKRPTMMHLQSQRIGTTGRIRTYKDRLEPLSSYCTAEGRHDARHAKAMLDPAANKTGMNDADGLTHPAEAGFLREVRVKGFDSMPTRTHVAAHSRLIRIAIEPSNQIRGVMNTIGFIVPPDKGSKFKKHVRFLLLEQGGFASIVPPLLEAWSGEGDGRAHGYVPAAVRKCSIARSQEVADMYTACVSTC
ncbi:hypothetical protein [Leisingera sp. NJS204]|uniref:hypothetical protein n=1 Tax=Leisingera sp. NJS204 TaxID=2508307 RepID=UPI0019812DCD